MGGFKCLKKCSVCDYTNKLTSQVRRHEMQSHGPNAVPCTFPGCTMRFAYNRLARHIREKHSSNYNKSNSPTNPIMTTQMTSNAPHQFNDVQLMDATTVAQELKQFGCPECGKMFNGRGQMRKHLNAVHGGATKRDDENSSKKASRRKKKQKVHKCDWSGCEQAFTAPAKLADHRNSHTGDRPYDCEHCKRNFGTKYEFGRHLRKYHCISIRELNSQIEKDIINNDEIK